MAAENFIPKTVTFREDQYEFIEKVAAINGGLPFSAALRMVLARIMEAEGQELTYDPATGTFSDGSSPFIGKVS